MGGAESRIPEDVDLETFERLAGFPCKDIFDAYVLPTGFISRDTAVFLAQSTDVFLTHDWGLDELGRDNHARVSFVNGTLTRTCNLEFKLKKNYNPISPNLGHHRKTKGQRFIDLV